MSENDRNHKFDGESIIVLAGHHIKLECCDCGLVHSVWPSYDPVTRLVSMMFTRDDEETKKTRRPMRKRKMGVFKKK